jgi:hypothetical protein
MRMAKDIATCRYHTSIDPFTHQEVIDSKQLRDLEVQRALLQFFKPENYFEVRKALNATREAANAALDGNHVHTIPSAK